MDAATRRSEAKEQANGVARFVLPQPYLLFLGDVVEPGFAKTAFGLRDWAADRCVGEYALPGARVTLGLPKLDPRAAVDRGARSMVIGVANAGGHIPPVWFGALLEALEAGLDLVSGMHVRLSSLPSERPGWRFSPDWRSVSPCLRSICSATACATGWIPRSSSRRSDENK